MVGTLQPLAEKFPIIGADGRPTPYFMRWAQQRQIDIGNAISQEALEAYLADHEIQAGTGITITPDGNIINRPTISLHASLGDLLDVDVITNPPTDGQVLTWVDADSKWEPKTPTGGGGGGGTSTALWATALGGLDTPIASATVTGSHTGNPNSSMSFLYKDDWYWNNGETAGSVVFDFGSPVIISGIGFVQDNTTAEGTWQASGSNDGISYTNLGSTGSWGGALVSLLPFVNSTAYRYYKVSQTAGSTSSSPYQRQFIFRWGAA